MDSPRSEVAKNGIICQNWTTQTLKMSLEISAALAEICVWANQAKSVQCPVREILSRPQDFFKKPCFLYLTEVNIFIQDGYLEDLMKHIIKFFQQQDFTMS